MFDDDDMLMLSGIQHFMFCPRQWALIHIEQLWEENRLTIEGKILHANVDNPFYRQKNGNTITLRSVPISSKELGLYGISDAIELTHAYGPSNAIRHHKYPGYWTPHPIEYKRGRSKPDERDIVQVVAQTMCLEEMYCINISSCSIYYGETHSREHISVDNHIRSIVKDISQQMHSVFNSGLIPKPILKPHCKNCSLSDICMPKLSASSSVSDYLNQNLYEKVT